MSAFATLEAALPRTLKELARKAYLQVAALVNAGSSVVCPCCLHEYRKLARFDRANDQCPGCGSLMRHRALQLYLDETLQPERNALAVLHVAPEPALAGRLSTLENVRYVSVDLSSRRATVQADLTDLPFAAADFDLVICLHVLEHVEADRAAMAELFRVLRPGGTAIIQVPPSALSETLEDVSATTRWRRLRRFGQHDHVRICGSDYGDRLSDAGFAVTSVDYVERLGSAARARYAVRVGEPFYICAKPGQPTHD